MLYACDGRWWNVYGAEAKAVATGEGWTSDLGAAEKYDLQWVRSAAEAGLCTLPGKIHTGGNSGYQAIGLAFMWGAAKIVLLGYDMQRTGGQAHWHGAHEKSLPNLGNLAEWARRMVQLGADLRARGVEVVNASRETALTCFPRAALPDALDAKPAAAMPLFFAGMKGLGDNLHQRAIVRQLVARHLVYLETPWPAIYEDLAGPRLRLVRPGATSLRTQAKNARREASAYHLQRTPAGMRTARTWYGGAEVRREGSILAAMVRNAGCEPEGADFRLPVAEAWLAAIDRRIAAWRPDKPILLYRPLVERTEWRGCAGRNPDIDAYRSLIAAIRERFFVVSVADLQPGVEWLVGHMIKADVELHAGELPFEHLAALAKRSALVFCSAGFAPILAQAVGTPVVCVFGGHESSMTISGGARFAPTLGIDPIVPCDCFDHSHKHQKAIDLPKALARLEAFLQDHLDADPTVRAAGSAAADD